MIGFFEMLLLVAMPLFVILAAGFLGWRRNIIQSSIKLGSVILSILFSVIIVKFVLPTQVDAVLALGSSFIEEDLAADFKGSAYATDLFRLLVTMLMPMIFVAVFFVMNSLFSLLYLIPGRLFSNKALARRAAKKGNSSVSVTIPDISTQAERLDIKVENPSIDIPVDSVGAEPAKAAGPDWRTVALKAGSVACSILAGILVISSFMLPVSFYADFAASCVETVDLTDLDSDSAGIVDVIYELDDHFTVNCYQVLNWPVSGSLNRFTSHTGTKVVATDTFIDTLEIAGCLNADELTSDACYTIANKLEENKFLNETLTGIAVDMLDDWKAGEAFIGVGVNAMPMEYIEILDSFLRDDRPFSVAMSLMGDVLSMSKSLQSDDPAALAETVESVIYNMRADTVNVFQELLQSSFSESSGENADVFIDFTEAVLDSVAKIKEDTALDDDEREDALKKEAECLTKIIKISTEDADADMVELVDICISSTTLTDAVLKATENGMQKDPYGLADGFTDEMVDEVCDKLHQKEIQEDSSTYKAYLALITGVA